MSEKTEARELLKLELEREAFILRHPVPLIDVESLSDEQFEKLLREYHIGE